MYKVSIKRTMTFNGYNPESAKTGGPKYTPMPQEITITGQTEKRESIPALYEALEEAFVAAEKAKWAKIKARKEQSRSDDF
jgi:hypothetical protein